jgi:ParB/RepB/Spo0J family partition protein
MTVMAIESIFPNPDQPRKEFSERKLEELAQSIRENGLLEPIVVTPRAGRFMIIAGERRFRACRLAGLAEVSVRVIEADDRAVAELALLENLQREHLNLIEEARAYRNLMDLGLSMEEVARKMGFKQTWRVRERLDLLRLHPTYQRYLVDRRITPSQAYEVSRLPEDGQHVVMQKLEEGRAETYNKLRALVNSLLVVQGRQTAIGQEMSADHKAVGERYDRMIERLVGFTWSSFHPDDLKILPRVVTSSLDVNIQRLDLIAGELHKIKKALIQAQAARDAAGKEAA